MRELGQRMELEGTNPYRARAYRCAVENLSVRPPPLERLVAEGRLKDIPGIGDALAALISCTRRARILGLWTVLTSVMPAAVSKYSRVSSRTSLLTALSTTPMKFLRPLISLSRAFTVDSV
ncbi:MAG: hypothetical protein J0H44_31110 [Alphaproteobacteria bacterium]|nr:hypothetical protein [Alphaproteobacteria bacterium]